MTGLGPWIRYLRYVPTRQVLGRIVHEVKLRTVALPANSARAARNPPGADPSRLAHFADRYRPLGDRFTAADKMYRGEFESKRLSKDFGDVFGIQWRKPIADSRYEHWEHDLVFFSYMLPLASHDPLRALRLASDLCVHLDVSVPVRFGRKPPFAFVPISLSLRIMALWSVLASEVRDDGTSRDPESSALVLAHIARCERMLTWTLESHLGFNHLVFNTAALAVCDEAEDRTSHKNLSRAVLELQRCVLADGFWVERSPTYHIHMLFIARALASLQQDDGTSWILAGIIDRMTTALDVVVHPDGEIATFNDAAIEDAVPPITVGWTPKQAQSGRTILRETGFGKLWNETYSLVMDAGPMGPDEVIGHGHADFLSFELSVMGERLFVDPGVASIAGGPARDSTRSAQSHNGPTLEGLEPAEFFGAWRVGRRGRAKFTETTEPLALAGECDGYAASAGIVSREVRLRERTLAWVDTWELPTAREKRATFLIDGHWTLDLESAETATIVHVDRGWRCQLVVAAGAAMTAESAEYFPRGPMESSPATRLMIRSEGQLTSVVLTLD